MDLVTYSGDKSVEDCGIDFQIVAVLHENILRLLSSLKIYRAENLVVYVFWAIF
jgi:hypothetical protein